MSGQQSHSGISNNSRASDQRVRSASRGESSMTSVDSSSNSSSARRQPLAGAAGSTIDKTSNTHRLSSIEILNENKQRQLQFKQQESFKQHLEQRQRKLLEQQQQQRGISKRDQSGGQFDATIDNEDLGVSYQVNTSAPDFMASALSGKTSSTGGLAINPFNDDHKRPTSAPSSAKDQEGSTTVSGKSGFLSALIDEASFESNPADRNMEELNSGTTKTTNRYLDQQPRYNYDENPDKRPFYEKDLPTLLQECRASRKLVIAIVAIALLLDNMLLTSVVPIIPFDLLKNRMIRKHQELEIQQSQMNVGLLNNSIARVKSKGSRAKDDDDDELDRLIDRSLANAKNRYSGSVLNPRVRGKPIEQNKKDDDDDDKDDDDDNDQVFNKSNNKQRAIPNMKMRQQQPPDRDYEDDDEDGGTSRRPMPQQSKGNKVMVQNGDDNDDDDDDDEDSSNSKKWTKLRKALISMAKANGNDTDSLAGMCLNLVMSDNDDDDDNDDEKPDRSSKKAGIRMRRAAAPLTILAKQPKKKKPQAPSTTTTTEKSTTVSVEEEMSMISHQDIVDESFEVGVMFASKPIVQAFANPFIGTLTNRVGFTIPMFTGFVIMFISTLVFAFGSSYSTLFIARAIQGVGSACTSVAGMSMLADRFPDDAERGNAMAIALGGLALGVVIGPPFGGFMYEFIGRSSPFIVLSFLALLDGLLQLLVLQPRVTKSQEEGASLMTLIKDPYILVAAGAITFANTGIAILEPALPLWMMDTMQAKNWEQGVAFLPAALSYMFGTNLFGNLGHKIGRWRSTMIGLIIIGCSLLLIPFATRVDHLIIPNGAIGFAMGMVDSTMMPMLGYLVDIRHTSVYGSVYAIGDVAFCASFAFGPALSGTLVELIGFEGLIITTALICFCFAPLLFLLRNPPPRQVLNEAQLQEQSTLRYVNYNHLDYSPEEEAQLTTNYKSKPSSLDQKAYVR